MNIIVLRLDKAVPYLYKNTPIFLLFFDFKKKLQLS